MKGLSLSRIGRVSTGRLSEGAWETVGYVFFFFVGKLRLGGGIVPKVSPSHNLDLLGLDGCKGTGGLGWRLGEHSSALSGPLNLTGGMSGGREPPGAGGFGRVCSLWDQTSLGPSD